MADCNGRLPSLWRRPVPLSDTPFADSTSSFYLFCPVLLLRIYHFFFVYLLCIYSPCTVVLFVTPVNEDLLVLSVCDPLVETLVCRNSSPSHPGVAPSHSAIAVAAVCAPTPHHTNRQCRLMNSTASWARPGHDANASASGNLYLTFCSLISLLSNSGS